MADLERDFDIYVIADYGIGDPAFTEIETKLRAGSREHGVIITPAANPISVPRYLTISTGFWIRQIGIEGGYPGAVIFSNTAPRGDEKAITWEGDERQRLLYGVLNNGVEVLAVSAGYNWSFVRNELRVFHDLDIPNSGSQFRSRDFYAPELVRFLAGDRSFLGQEIDPGIIPDYPLNHIAHRDGYVNLKLTTRRDQFPADLVERPFLEATIGTVTRLIFNGLAGNPAPVGEIGLVEGSSGGKENRFLELVLVGGSAYEAYGYPEVSDHSGQVEFQPF